MKKILLSTAMIVATAGVAAAEVTLSGSGRVGLVYNDGAADGVSSTIISYRLRFNVDAKLESDNGVTYGGRIRFQDDTDGDGFGDNAGTSPFSPALIYAEYSGFRVEVGNSNTAYDSVALMYNPELGYRGTSFGDPQSDYYSFNSGPYRGQIDDNPATLDNPATPAVENNEFDPRQRNRVGIYAAYSINGLNLKASYVQTDQVVGDNAFQNTVGQDGDEWSVAADYTFGQITVAAAYADTAFGLEGNDLTFAGVAYAFSDVGNVGFNYNDNGTAAVGDTYTIYGNYKFGATTVGAYITDADQAGSDTAYGVGASYDLGGANLAASWQSGFDSNDVFDLGISMNF